MSQKCKVHNGYRTFVETDGLGIGHKPLDIDSVGYLDVDRTARLVFIRACRALFYINNKGLRFSA